MIVDNLGINMLNDDECVITGSLVQNNIPILEENYVRKMNANNGFSGKRMFRQICSIPIAEQVKAVWEGRNLDDKKELHKFLQDNPDYMTVERLKTLNTHNLIIK